MSRTLALFHLFDKLRNIERTTSSTLTSNRLTHYLSRGLLTEGAHNPWFRQPQLPCWLPYASPLFRLQNITSIIATCPWYRRKRRRRYRASCSCSKPTVISRLCATKNIRAPEQVSQSSNPSCFRLNQATRLWSSARSTYFLVFLPRTAKMRWEYRLYVCKRRLPYVSLFFFEVYRPPFWSMDSDRNNPYYHITITAGYETVQ